RNSVPSSSLNVTSARPAVPGAGCSPSVRSLSFIPSRAESVPDCPGNGFLKSRPASNTLNIFCSSPGTETKVARLLDSRAASSATMQATSFYTGRMLVGVVGRMVFFSGFAALLYQVVWMRHLSLFFGSDVYAAAITLSAFMGGLCAGSMLAQRFVGQ